MMNATPSRSDENMNSPWGAVSVVFELGYLIALPVALLGFGGAYFDKYMQTSPLFLALGLLMAFVISAFAVIGKLKSLVKKMS